VRMVDPDRHLVARSLAGDLRAFEALVRRHENVAYRVAARIAGPNEAEDVTQDAFVRAFHRLPHFRAEGHFRAWLLQIVHNTALNARARRPPEPVETFAAVVESQGGQVQRTPAERLEGRERRDRLESKLRLLTPAHRAVLVLRDVEGLSYDEIAEATETPLGSVKGRLHRARRELIGILRENAYDWGLPE
jgi:RNA polymerase sigma-70 factor (ECF subfamily)